MYGGADPTGATAIVQWILIAVIVLPIAVTARLWLLGLSGGTLGVAFIATFVGTLILS
ncbi:hypothetical protein ATJ93_3683 [Halopiger aswanensis]|uniref:Uncharacterized protein n=1 Tax=Halopiger aswanensis TaxID=148449 RepID=A0A419W065_9EURY|nr:hypothetical protein ATJ93_3683 [Halopiger aswanensis]